MVSENSEIQEQWYEWYTEADPTPLLALNVLELPLLMRFYVIETCQCVMGYGMLQHFLVFLRHPKGNVQDDCHTKTDHQEVFEDGSVVSRQGTDLAQATPKLYEYGQVNMQQQQPEEVGQTCLEVVYGDLAQCVEILLLVIAGL